MIVLKKSDRPVTIAASRRGTVLFATLVLLAVAMMVFGVGIRSVLQEDRQLRLREFETQAHRLAEAGAQRAALFLGQEGDAFKGETWDIDAAQLGGRYPARVTSRIEANPDTGQNKIVATAQFPLGAVYRAQVTVSRPVSSRVANLLDETPANSNPTSNSDNNSR